MLLPLYILIMISIRQVVAIKIIIRIKNESLKNKQIIISKEKITNNRIKNDEKLIFKFLSLYQSSTFSKKVSFSSDALLLKMLFFKITLKKFCFLSKFTKNKNKNK